MNTYTDLITELKDDEVFVFGANLDGFHGAGAAGYATFGERGNVWRDHGYGKWPNGTKGRWNVKGELGPQIGREGKSYALPTVVRAGMRRSLEPDFRGLYLWCNHNPNWKFYFAQTSQSGLNGWTPSEMATFMKRAGPIPANLYIHQSLAPYLT